LAGSDLEAAPEIARADFRVPPDSDARAFSERTGIDADRAMRLLAEPAAGPIILKGGVAEGEAAEAVGTTLALPSAAELEAVRGWAPNLKEALAARRRHCPPGKGSAPYAIALCHCLMPLPYAIALCHCLMPLPYAIALCHCLMPLPYANALCHCLMPFSFNIRILLSYILNIR
jgi:hypothetical protein